MNVQIAKEERDGDEEDVEVTDKKAFENSVHEKDSAKAPSPEIADIKA